MKICLFIALLWGVPHWYGAAVIEGVRATGYTHSEPDHLRYGRLNCQGKLLNESQCAADLRYYPLGTRLEIITEDGDSFVRVVADCGSAVVGSHHIDLYWKTRERMARWDTRMVRVRVID